MVIKTFYPDIAKPFDEYLQYFDMISPERREKALRLHSEKSKIISVMTAVFARECIEKLTDIPAASQRFYTNENGKPFLSDIEGFCFNVSHSDGCIAFVHSNKPVGIDVERIRKFDSRLPKRYFTENEQMMLNTAEDKYFDFRRIWTTKEAYIKMKGSTLANMVRHVDVYKILDAEINTITEHGYVITACEQVYN
ncbi:MAG: 4'-phosphopantetheinyl transferase superfamily protein [Ruminococcus sp.]|jgi:4'-phosphopantetheinyl transferase|nr:4'-phosphopantetheinyl transferase superfamily protein [Ruminococcus sp.]